MCPKYVQTIKEIEILLRENKRITIFPAKYTFSQLKKELDLGPTLPYETLFVKNFCLFYLLLPFSTPETLHIQYNTSNNLRE